MKEYSKFIIIFPITGTFDEVIRKNMDHIARILQKDPLYLKMIPHVSLHRPITTLSFEKVKNLTESIAQKLHKSRIRIGGIDHFGKEYIVTPVYATRTVASLWSGIHELFAQVPEYEHSQFDHDNTLHITLVEKCSDNFDEYWSRIEKECFVEPEDFLIDRIALFGKSDTGWECVHEIMLPDRE